MSAQRTRLAFGSCNKHDRPQPAWAYISARKPEKFLWLGDIVYADQPVFLKYRLPSTAEHVQELLEAQAAHADYAPFAASVSIDGVYDDHDYGENDGGRVYNATARDRTPLMLLDFLQEPLESDRRVRAQRGEGVHTSFILGTGARRVKIILLDNRTNRDPYGDEDWTTDMLGSAQWEWLHEQLITDRTPITIIGAGLQMLARGDPLISESWSRMPASQARLISMIAHTNTSGAVLISGDVHYSEVNMLNCSAVGYPLYDFTSSGMTHSWGGLLKRTVVESALMGATRVGSLYDGRNWGEIDIDWAGDDHKIDIENTRITFRTWGVDDNLTHIEVALKLSELQRPAVLKNDLISPLQYKYLANGLPTRTTTPLEHFEDVYKACALGAGTSARDCELFMHTCRPGLSNANEMRYVVSHGVIFGMLGAIALSMLLAPVLACICGKRLPLGATGTLALLVLIYAGVWQFITTLH